MKKLILGLVMITGFCYYSQAQSMGSTYKTGIGVKFYPGALSVKHFVKDNRAIEGLLQFWNDGMQVTGLYEFHGDINGAPGLKWYAGPGAHLGAWSSKWKDAHDGESGLLGGVDGVLGLDYKINGAPINLSIDWQPSFNFIGYSDFNADFVGLGIRFTF